MNNPQGNFPMIAVMLLLHSLLQSLFVLLGARIAKIENRTYKFAFLSALLTDISGGVLFWLLGGIPYLGKIIAFAAATAVGVATVKTFFHVAFRKAIITVAVAFGLSILLTILATVIAFIGVFVRSGSGAK